MQPKHVFLLLAIAAICYLAPPLAKSIAKFLVLTLMEGIKLMILFLESAYAILEGWVS